jgi:hypothetical protein
MPPRFCTYRTVFRVEAHGGFRDSKSAAFGHVYVRGDIKCDDCYICACCSSQCYTVLALQAADMEEVWQHGRCHGWDIESAGVFRVLWGGYRCCGGTDYVCPHYRRQALAGQAEGILTHMATQTQPGCGQVAPPCGIRSQQRTHRRQHN